MTLQYSENVYRSFKNQIHDARELRAHHSSTKNSKNKFITLECEILIIGSGAGGSILAAEMCKAKKNVILAEEGPLLTSKDFTLTEKQAYPELYQESASRTTKDRSVQIFQGRCVGGSTTVNWTSSFRTPKTTLKHWRDNYGLSYQSENSLEPFFNKSAKLLNIRSWEVPANPNNSAIENGAKQLGIHTGRIDRNVKGCLNLGYCGLGCPVDAKQSGMAVTIPIALKNGCKVFHHMRIDRIEFSNGKAIYAEATPVEINEDPKNQKIRIFFKDVILAAGAIGSPAILLRSNPPVNPSEIGRRTFLHPSAIIAGVFKEDISPFAGAPQSVYSDDFLTKNPETDPIGFKIEAAPVFPIMAATLLPNFGQSHREFQTSLSKTAVTICLLRDGFHEESQGGNVQLLDNEARSPKLDYPISPYVWDGVKRAYLTATEMQFAAGAKKVVVAHTGCEGYQSWNEAREAIPKLKLHSHWAKVVSAHVMGGIPMGILVDESGRFRASDNVFIADGSIFPTSVGTNPQWTIYANAFRIAKTLNHA